MCKSLFVTNLTEFNYSIPGKSLKLIYIGYKLSQQDYSFSFKRWIIIIIEKLDFDGKSII